MSLPVYYISTGYASYPETGSCYKFHNMGATWVEAKVICDMEGAYFAIINSENEANVLTRLFTGFPENELEQVDSYEVARIGLRKIAKRWEYTDGEIIHFKYDI